MSEHLNTYAEGWTKGEAETILRAAASDYVFDDPNAGLISKEQFASYFEGMRQTVDGLRGGAAHATFMNLTEVVTSETDGELTAWCWWAIPGTQIEGAGLIKVGPDGVHSEKITYYTRLSSVS